jgi:hypothetical protein
MRLRFTVLAAAASSAACALVPSVATAAVHPHVNRAMTIHATPRMIIAGEPVLIFGRLEGRDAAHQVVHLWHRINPKASFTIIGTARTDASGRYEFTRAEGIVDSNRNWFVRGPVFTHSHTIHERVAAEVTLAPSATEGRTRHPLTFTGHVTPGHRGTRVALQVQRGAANRWTTVTTGRVGAGSNYTIAHAWRTAGEHTVRVRFAGDARNTPAVSDPTSVVIDQTQQPAFTIATSDAIVTSDASATITGTLDAPHTATPQAGAAVSLVAHEPGTGSFKVVQSTTTAADGGYSFTVQGTTNELYQVRTTATPTRASAILFQGVEDAVTMSASAPTSSVGQTVQFTGSVAPDDAGHPVYLQKLGRDGHWHTAKTGTVSSASTFTLPWTFGTAGSKEFRARVLGDGANVGGASAATTIAVAQPPLAQLPGD